MATRDIYEDGFDEESGKTTQADTCPECKGKLATDGGETSCIERGLVVGEYRLDHGPKWVSFEDTGTNAERTGAPITPDRHDRGLSTEIGFGGDANGNPLRPRKRAQMSRLRREHSRARWRTTAERNLAHACGEVARMTGALDLSKAVRKEACMLYRKAQRANLIRGRSIETIASGSLYAACRRRGSPIRVEDVASVARCSADKVTLGYRVLNVELGLETPIVNATDRIPRLAADTSASPVVQHRALELAERAEQAGLTNGRNPSGVAAACLYLAGREQGVRYTQAELARLADVAPPTIRKRYYELQELVG